MAHELSLSPMQRIVATGNRNLDTSAIWCARTELAACLRMASRLGLEEGICNHFSAVVPGHPDLFLVNRLGWAFSEATASSLLICTMEGQVIAGDGVPEATAFFIHACLHKHCPRIGAAFHTHMPNATALGMTAGPPFVWAGQTALKFYGRIAVDEAYNGLALDTREGDRIAAALGTCDILFMKNHGVMVCAPTIAEAWDDLYYLERAAEVQVKAMSTGRPLVAVSPQIASETARQMREGDAQSAQLHLESICRILDRSEPEYRV
ncbi:aldolase [Komagataeibacter medellinensis]|uniref:Ribulose-5-phosphate 4-epimerase n=1 Tax=Komagataeibacter medellinensis (strain NBRC 3288 / BCRC 11682 / LMG 1693 / Kondo 51) TaxID=634177 RepID=G2I6X5_KOMMN|nr:aldolase [Komagataeibacter medellinensis]BAK83872.1 ribulose-5-phosphate 4-epimerase [Komagataeibacter medellinensis NBRC 3288]